MVPEVSLKLSLDIVDKSLRISEVILEKSFKVGLCDKSSAFMAMLDLKLIVSQKNEASNGVQFFLAMLDV